MKLLAIGFLFVFIVAQNANGESFLTAQSFPKTFEDVSFTEKLEFKTNDYDLYRPVYDAFGNCVQNCAYYGLNIIQETEQSAKDTKNAVEKSKQYEQNKQKLSIDTKNIINSVSLNYGSCANRNNDIPVGQKVPWGEPLKSLPRISSTYGPRKLEGKTSFHDGIDYAVGVGTPVYAPADGKVVRVINDNTCGKGLRLQHEDGTQTIYCHLSNQMVSNGAYVGAGCKIAETGNTGHSTGPHLHYGMRDASNNKIDPGDYTKRRN